MTTERTPQPPRPGPAAPPSAEEAEVRALLVEAGPRPAPPAEDLRRIQAAARQEWERMVAEERARAGWRRFVLPAALAAGVLLAVAAFWWLATASWWLRRPGPLAPPPTLASVRQVVGETWSEGGRSGSARSGRRPLRAGEAVLAGALVATEGGGATGHGAAPGRLALQLADGASLRLDTGTRVRLVAPGRLELAAGGVYLDSGPSAAKVAWTIETPLGAVREIGTRFEVRLTGAAHPELRVRVREGAVALRRPTGEHRVAAGGELRVAGDGSLHEGSIAASDSAWEWVQAVAPSLDIEGASLAAYLAWVARETGWALRYDDRELERMAPTVVLHGSIEGLTPAQSLEAVLPGSGLTYRVEAGMLRVGR